MVLLDTILTFRGPGDGPSPYREEALGWAAMFADARFNVYGKPEHLEHEIYRIRNMLDRTCIEDLDRAVVIGRLSYLEGLRLDGTANTHEYSRRAVHPSESPKLPSFRDLIAPLPEAMAGKPTSMKTLGKHLHPLRASYIKRLTVVLERLRDHRFVHIVCHGLLEPGKPFGSSSFEAVPRQA